MGGVRQAISRFRFSWIELFGIALAVRAIDMGWPWVALAVVVIFGLAQAIVESWPS